MEKCQENVIPTKMTILWYNQQIVAVLLGESVIYNSDILVPMNAQLLEMYFEMPMLEAIVLATVLVNGIAITKLKKLMEVVNERIAELKKLENDNKELDLDLGGW